MESNHRAGNLFFIHIKHKNKMLSTFNLTRVRCESGIPLNKTIFENWF